MSRSRLSTRLERKTKKNVLLTISAIVVILFLVFKVGIPMLVNLSLFLSGASNPQDNKKNNQSFIPPPVLHTTFSATNSATITLKGSARDKQIIQIYKNDKLIDEIVADKDDTFETDVKLSENENVFQAKAEEDNNKSDFSNTITIIYKKGAPSLSVDSPSDNQSFSKDQNTLAVNGKTDTGARVTVNDFWAIVRDDGKFSYTLTLKNGENFIKIIATDEAGNQTENTIKVNYSP